MRTVLMHKRVAMHFTHARTYSVLWYRYSVHWYWLPRKILDKPLCGQNESKQIVMILSMLPEQVQPI